MTDSEKSSLLQYEIIYSRKKFIAKSQAVYVINLFSFITDGAWYKLEGLSYVHFSG